MWLKYFLAWLPMILIAVTNGALRHGIYLKYSGELGFIQHGKLFSGNLLLSVAEEWKHPLMRNGPLR
jgi:hypothetical protein